MKKFSLINVILYSKHWYLRSDNIWDDLNKCVSADGYGECERNKSDIIGIILNHFMALKQMTPDEQVSFIHKCSPMGSWKYGHNSKNFARYFNCPTNKFPEWDYYDAVIYVILSELLFTSKKLLPELHVPDPDVLPLTSGGLKRWEELNSKEL